MYLVTLRSAIVAELTKLAIDSGTCALDGDVPITRVPARTQQRLGAARSLEMSSANMRKFIDSYRDFAKMGVLR